MRPIDADTIFPNAHVLVWEKDGETTANYILKLIKDAPTLDVEPVRHGRWIKTNRHKWREDDGEIDEFAYECGYHHGPVCEICGFSFCKHCDPEAWKDQSCDEQFVCSECGRLEKKQEPYCHCGAKMDGGEADD